MDCAIEIRLAIKDVMTPACSTAALLCKGGCRGCGPASFQSGELEPELNDLPGLPEENERQATVSVARTVQPWASAGAPYTTP